MAEKHIVKPVDSQMPDMSRNPEEKNRRALIAMSGGVDSSAAALLMLQKGWDCAGVNMRLHDNAAERTENEKSCCSLSDAEDARQVCVRLGIPFYVFNEMQEFDRAVIERFVAVYEAGGTPNPCIDCNRFMKFGRLFQRMNELGYDAIVTGHYARTEQRADGRWLLRKAVDLSKDQSYVLYSLTQDQLAHVIFPLGTMTKPEVRELAQAHGFANAQKKESQDICFVPDGDYAGFIERRTGYPYAPGNFVLEDGTVVGSHKGLIHYTIGQRRGLGVAWSEPLYVLRKDMAANSVILGRNSDLFTSELTACDFNWIACERLQRPLTCKAQTRYRSKETPCTVYPEDGGRVRIHFDEPVRAVTSGQAVVLYEDDLVLGGGTIC